MAVLSMQGEVAGGRYTMYSPVLQAGHWGHDAGWHNILLRERG